ncbi:hypothetical protein ISS07_04880 [Candidatus Woesearchaeota archaeon]|nr:hypothetical protein [Candidatus Woesearchaeota archaeon]
MKIEELAKLMGKTQEEMEEMLKKDDMIELKLSERKQKEQKDTGEIKTI